MISIVMTLLERERASAAYFAEKFEVSERTIYRDAETLALAGIPISSRPGPGGGLSIMPEYKVDKKLFTASDISNLLMGLGSIAQAIGRDGAATLEKLRSLIPSEKSREIELRSGQLLVDLNGWMHGAHINRHLEVIKNALFTYTAREGEQSRRTAEPHRLVVKDGNWYLQAFCRLKDAFRLFKLSRMSGLEKLAESFEPRPLPEVAPEFSGKMEAGLIPIRLRVSGRILDRILDHCGPENISRADDGAYLALFEFMPDDFGYGILLGFGSECECLGPPEIRAELARRIELMRGIYSGNKKDRT